MTKTSCPFKPGDRVWAYCRDSGGEEQQDSVASQRRAIEDYARRHNVLVVQVFTDEARPGSTTVGRDGLEDLLYLARRDPRPVDGIIFWSFSRLAREQLAAQFIKSDLRLRGYVLHSMTDDVPFGEFAPVVEALIDWKNERYLKDLSRDVKRGLHDLTQNGYAPGGFPPRGYTVERVSIGAKRNGEPHVVSRWIPDPELAPRVRQAFQMRANGASYQQILDATHVFPVRGSYVTMFRNKSYLGIQKCGELEIEGAFEPLVDRETWDAVQATLRPKVKKGDTWAENKQHPRRVESPYLLSGLAKCSECGAAMIGQVDRTGRHTNPFRYYICGRKVREGWAACGSGKVRADWPEAALLQVVNEQVLTPGFVMTLVSEVNAALIQDEPTLYGRIEEAQRRLAEVDKSIAALLDLAEQFGAASAAARLLDRETEQRRLQAELEHLRRQQETRRLTVSPDRMREILGNMKETLASGDIQAKRALLAKLVVSLEIGKDRGKVSVTFPLSCAGFYTIPPGGCCIKNRTMEFGSAAE